LIKTIHRRLAVLHTAATAMKEESWGRKGASGRSARVLSAARYLP
jgi:hypothetical protein